MVQKIESPVGYETRPESDFALVEMPDDVIVATSKVLEVTQDRKRFSWIGAGGMDHLDGLAEHVTATFQPHVPKCDPSTCRIHATVQAYSPAAGDVDLHFDCGLIQRRTKKETTAVEARCHANHEAARDAFGAFVVDKARELGVALMSEEAAKTRLKTAKKEVDDLINP